MWHEWGIGGVRRGFYWGYLWGRDHFEDLGVNGRVILKWVSHGVSWITVA